MAESLYDELTGGCSNLQYEIVIDDRLHLSIGQRVKQAQASGYPHIVVLGKQVSPSRLLTLYISVQCST